VGHFNHRLRGEQADADERFVRQLAEQLGVAFQAGQAECPARPGGDGLEAAARAQRYGFLRSLADHVGARYVVTAHTADDQAETVLHRVLRGTGLSGLAGIPAARRLTRLTTLVRPMLTVTRHAVLNYLQALGQPYCVDASNEKAAFTRNRIRSQLMPLLESSFNPRVGEALVRLGRLAQQAQEVIVALVEPLLSESVTAISRDRVRVACPFLRAQAPYVICEFLIALWKRQHWPLQNMTSAKWDHLARLMLANPIQPRRLVLPGPITVCFGQEAVEFTRGRVAKAELDGKVG
jgi:tRNA(Ile)-lysidine synthase